MKPGVIEETENEIILDSYLDKQAIGVFFIVFAIPFLLPLFFGYVPLAALSLIGISFIIFGILCISKNKKIYFKRKNKKIVLPAEVYQYKDFNYVLVTSYLKTTTSDNDENQSITIYKVFIVKRKSKNRLSKNVNRYQKLINSSSANNSKTKKIIKRLHNEITSHHYHSVQIFESYDDMSTWYVAEKIAHELNANVIDTCHDYLLFRQADELNMSLKDRLKCMRKKFEIPENRPSDVKVTVNDDAMSILYPMKDSSINKKHMSIIVAIVILQIIIGCILSSIMTLNIFLSIPIFLLVSDRIQSRKLRERLINEIIVNHDKLIIKIKNEIEKPILLSDIEMLRVNRGRDKALSIITDDEIYKLPMPTKFSKWISGRLEYFLATAK